MTRCPNCGSEDVKVERNRSPAIICGAEFMQIITGQKKKLVDVVTCNNCHTISQSDGARIQVI